MGLFSKKKKKKSNKPKGVWGAIEHLVGQKYGFDPTVPLNPSGAFGQALNLTAPIDMDPVVKRFGPGFGGRKGFGDLGGGG